MKLKRILFMALMALVIQSAFAYDFMVDGIAYDINSDGKSVTVTYTEYYSSSNYPSLSGTVAIPPSVTYSGTTYSVTSIGYYAFSGCSGLTSVTIPGSVTSIGYNAFDGCTGLTSVTIPNSVTSIGEAAFYGCTGLTSVTIGNSVTEIGDWAFRGCTGLTSVTIPISVTSIGKEVFYECSGLTSVTIPNSVTHIGSGAFSGCSGLTSVTIPNSVTSIGSEAFYGCTGLTSVTIPNSVTSIGYDAFYKCTGLTSVTWNAKNCSDFSFHYCPFNGCTNIKSFKFGNEVEKIPAYLCYSLTGLTSVTIVNSVVSIGSSAFSGCTGLTSVTIPNSVTEIGKEVFYECSGLTSVTIPNSVTSIGSEAFYGCTGLTSVTIGNSVTSIGDGAFYGCSALTSIKVESGNSVYDSRENCNAIIKTATNTLVSGCKNTVIPGSVTSIGVAAFYKCIGLTSVTIGNSVTEIGDWAFRGCTGLTSVTIPNSVTEIGKEVFYECSGLTSVTIPNSVTHIGSRAFYCCTGLTNVIWNVKTCSGFSLSYPPFDGCANIKTFKFGSEVEKIPAYLCYNLTGLTSVTIGNSVSSIGYNAFQCTAWYNDQPDGLVYAGLVAYKYKGTMPSGTSIVLKDGTKGIVDYAFASCRGLTSVTIPNSVTSIGVAAFYKCTGLTSVIWNAKNCKDFSLSSYTPFNDLTNIKSFEFGSEVEKIPAYLCCGLTGLTSVTIGNSVTSIGDEAFYDCTGLTSVTWNAKNCNDFSSFFHPFENSTNIKTFKFGSEVEKIPAYLCCGLTGLTSVTIGSSVTSIGALAFSGCSGLSEITSLPMAPPSLGNSCFSGVDKSIPVYVPDIEAYQRAYGWKEFTNYLPIGAATITKLTVQLPADYSDGRYKDSYIEVDNTDGSTHHRCLVTDKQNYMFSLAGDATYNVKVVNALGVSLGEKNGVMLSGEETTVSFESLKRPHEVSLAVTLPDGEDVTDRISITWTHDTAFVAHGPYVNGLVEGMTLTYSLKLSGDLVAAYVQPQPEEYTVNGGDNGILVELLPFGTAKLTGTVADVNKGLPITRATVSFTQTINGRQSRSVTAHTDSDGNFELEAFATPGSLTASANGYISVTVDVDKPESTTTIGTLNLTPITGVTVTTNFTHLSSVRSGESASTDNYYAGYADVSYTIFNKTQGREITQYSVQYPELVLLEDVSEGDKLEVAAHSLTGAFADVFATCVVADNRAAVTLPIVDYGGIAVTVGETDAATTVGLLYDGTGEQSRRGTFSDGAMQFDNLPDGEYTIVAMQQSAYLNGVLNLTGLTAAGLRAGTDFISQTVKVSSGVISEVTIAHVPALDESALSYTGPNTYFSAGVTSLSIGMYAVLSSRIDFKNAYRGKTGNVSLLFNLPQGCEFVERSVMVDNVLASYSREGQRISVSVPDAGGQVKFCVIPTLAGEVRPSAAVKMTLNGNNLIQPIGTAAFVAKALDIQVPGTTASPDIAIAGSAPSGSTVNIYDNDELIGTTTATAGGTWIMSCTLPNAYNLSYHQINAKAITKSGTELSSQSAECVIDRDAIQVNKVIMYHDNPEVRKNYAIEFDFQNASNATQSYIYYIYNKKFTFTIDFTANDTTKISNVVLHVKTGDQTWTSLPAEYDENLSCWAASGEFGNMYDGNIPINVAVSYDCDTQALLSAEAYDASVNFYSDLQAGFKQETDNINKALDELNTLWNSDDYNSDASVARRDEIYASLGITIDKEPVKIYTDEEMDNLLVDCERVLADSIGFQANLLFQQSYDEINSMTEGFTVGHCTGLTEAQLLAEGYEKMGKDDGTCIFTYLDENKMKIADLANDICYEFDLTSENPMLAPLIELAQSNDDFSTRMNTYSQKVATLCNDIRGKLDDLGALLDDIFKGLLARSNELENNLHLCDKQINYLKSIEHQTLDQSLRQAKFEFYRARYAKELTINHKIRNFILSLDTKSLRIGKIKVNGITGMGKYVKLANKLFVAYDIYSLVKSWQDNIGKIFDTYNMIPNPCNDDKVGAAVMRASVISLGLSAGAYYSAQLLIDFSAISTAVVGTLATLPSGGSSLSIVGVSVGIALASYLATRAWDNNFDKLVAHQVNSIKLLSCYRETGLGPKLSLHYSKTPDVKPTIDPSGFVYEAVPSNRLPGVTATIYYKETVEDMWGQPAEREEMWDAEEYAQRNPLFTDENGMYQWDVPQGLWQVRFAKQGYEPARSEWLPVPPPQLDVNIGMTQLRQPEVAMVHAYSDGVELTFDKYMRPSTLTGDNIRLTYKGADVESRIELLDEERGESDTYARKVRIVPQNEFADGEVTLSVLPAVESYAGVTMNSAFEQAFGIEPHIRVIAVDSVLNVGYGESREVKVQVLPLDVAAGRTLMVNSSQPVIASVEDGDMVTLDSHGKATLTVAGNLPGATTMTLSVYGFDLRQQARINVVDESALVTATPVATQSNGQVFSNSLTIELSCETEGAEIWYTLDGSCPCDPESRLRYTGPITIDRTTTLKALAQAPGHYESDIATYYYFQGSSVSDVMEGAPFSLRVSDGALVLNGLKSGPCNVSVYSLSGAEVMRRSGVLNGERLDLSHLAQGVYIAVVIADGRPTPVRFVL